MLRLFALMATLMLAFAPGAFANTETQCFASDANACAATAAPANDGVFLLAFTFSYQCPF